MSRKPEQPERLIERWGVGGTHAGGVTTPTGVPPWDGLAVAVPPPAARSVALLVVDAPLILVSLPAQ